jgi:chromosome segregation ATPase
LLKLNLIKTANDLFFLIRYDSVNTQRQRDKQRLTDLERNLNEERQNKQRLETQIKTEKTLTKKLQDDLTKLSLTPTKFVFSFLLSF